ncbi:MAG: leukotoxin LktA family filamentous adhesin [Pseudomonadota bacterium]|nr:leukotoxin LktA family filamentous adhesin [Pseudomonadota bacterium]
MLATTAMVVALPFVSTHFAAAQVTADGRTATSITRNGGTTNVRTGTIANNHGVNSFSSFNVRQGATVNLHAPNGTRGTVNIVNGSQAQIHGMVRGMQNGAVGGDVYIAAPNGVVVGPTGTIRAGSIGLSTPSQSVVNNLFGTGGSVNPQGIGQIIDGTVPLGPGNIAMNGALTADQRIRLRAGGQVGVNGSITAGQSVDIYGQQGVTFGGNATVRAQDGNAGGTIRVRSGGDIVLERGAKILSQSTGSANAGVIDIYADGSALLSQGAVISAAAHGSGTGGFVEFSATNTVEALGDLEAFSAEGQGGKILIDPLHAVLTGTSTNGADYEVIATETITLQSGAIITTVSASGPAGNVTLTAPQITLESGAQIIATDGTNPGGTIHIEARIDDRLTDETTAPGDVSQNALPIGHAKVSITGAILKGDVVHISATAFKDNKVDVESATDAYLNSLAGPLGDFEAVQEVLALASEIGSAAQAQLDKIDIENLPMFLDAHATIEMDGSYIQADTDAIVVAHATTHFEIAPENQNVALAIAASNTVARTTLHNTAIDAGSKIEVHSVVTEEQTLVARSGVSDPDVDPTAFNLAVAASLRRSRAETIVNGIRPVIGFDPYANTNPDTSNYLPWNPNVDQGEYAILTTGGTIDIAALTTRDILMTSDAVLSDEAKGVALALSLENSLTETYFGGAMAAQSGQIDIRAETTVERFGSRARVSGGSEAVENVDPDSDNQGVDPDEQTDLQPDVTDLVLGNFTLTDAVNTALSSKMGSGSGGSGDDSDGRFALAGSIIVHSTRSIAEVGGDHEYEAPDGTTSGLYAPLIETTPDGSYGRPGGQFYADGSKIDLDAEPSVTITARNTLQDIRVETLTQVGSVPAETPEQEGDLTGETEEELATSGKNVLLVSVGITQWGLGAEVLLDGDEDLEREGRIRSPSDAGLIAENVFAETEGREDVGDWWGEYREALEETESDDPADLPETPEESDPGEGDTGDGGDGGDEEAGGGGGGLPGGGSNRPGRKGNIGNFADGTDGSLTGEKDEAPDAGETDPDAGETDPDPAQDAPEDADDPVAQTPTDTRMFVAETTGRGSEIGAGINILSTNFELDATATVEDARFERETYFRSNDRDNEDEQARAFAIARNTGDIIASAGLPGTSTGGEKGGYGGALSLVDVHATARTTVSDSAVFSLENTEQRSEQDLLIVNTARAQAQNDDGGTGLNIAVAITNFTAITDAQNHADAIEGSGDDGVVIRADDTSSVVTLAGSGSLDADKGFAIGVAVNLTDRDTSVVVTSPDINVERDIDIGASTSGSILAAGTASAQDSLPDDEETPDDPDTPEDESQAEIPDEDPDQTPVDLSSDLFGDKADDVAEAMGNGDDGAAPDPGDGGTGDSGGGTKTFSFAGDFAATFGTVTTEVLIEGAEIGSEFEQKIEISALTDIEYGQASSVTASAVDGVGIAGSFGLSLIDHQTRADVLDSSIFVYEDEAGEGEGVTSITAIDRSVFDTLVTGRAAHSEDAWGVAVSASFNQFKSAASVDIEDTKITNGRFFDFSFGEGEGEGDGGFDLGDFDLGDGFDGEEGYEGEGGEGDYTCVDEICSDNTVGREILIHAEALPVSTVTVFAARDEAGAETSGDQQMDKMSDQMEDAAKQAEEPQDQAPDPGDTPDPDPGTDPDAGGDQPDEEKGKGRKGVSISIAPSVVHATASVAITDSFMVADRDLPDAQSPGKIDVLSKAVTTSNVDASAGTVGLSFAMTDTESVVWIQNSELLAPGNGSVSIRSEVGEVQEVSARVESDSRVKVAGILSLRDAVNRVIIDGGANNGSVISGGTGVTIAATTTHDLGFVAHASDSTSLVLAGAGIVSLGDADTAVFMGGEAISGGTVGISASDTTTRYEAEAIVTTGSLTDEELDEEIEEGGGPDKPKTPFGKRDKAETPDASSGASQANGNLTDALANIADEQSEKAEDTAEDQTGGGDPTGDDDEKKAGNAISFAIAINADRMDTTVTALIGGTVTGDQIAGDLDLSEGQVTASDVTLTASQELSQYRKVSATKAGSLDDKIGFVGTFSYGFIGSAVTAQVGPTVTALGAADLAVRATNALPTNSLADIQNPLNDTTLGLKTIDDSEALLAGDLLPDPALEMDQENWNILNRTEGQAGIGFAVDLGIHTAKLDTTAEIADGAKLDADAAVTLEAENQGGLIALRDIPVEESVAPEKQDEVDPPATVPVDGLTDEIPGDDLSKDDRDDARDEEERTMGTVGIGGAVQYLRLDANATARFGVVDTAGSVALESLQVSASNDMQGMVVTKSFGAAENVAFNGGFSILDYRGDARALVDDRNPLVIGDFTTIDAEDTARLLAFGGAGSQAGKVAVGLGAGIIFADRSAFGAVTSASADDILANLEGSSGAPDLGLGDLTITTETGGYSVSGASAGAEGIEDEAAEEPTPDDPDTPEDESEAGKKRGKIGLPDQLTADRQDENEEGLGEQTTTDDTGQDQVSDQAFGFALAADFGGVFGTNTAVSALATDAAIDLTSLTLSAENTADALIGTGAMIGTGGNIGLAGAVSISDVKTEVHALVAEGILTLNDGDVSITAKDSGDLLAASAGRGGAGGTFSLVGSGTLHLGRSVVEAQVTDATLKAGGDITVEAELTGATVAVAGSLAREVAEEAREEALGDNNGETAQDYIDDVNPLAEDTPIPDADDSGEAGEGTGEGTGDPQQEEDSDSIGVGITYAQNTRVETVRAEFLRTNVTANSLELDATNARQIDGVAAATGDDPEIGLSASVVVNVLNQTTEARIIGHHSTDAHLNINESIDILAENTSDAGITVGFSGAGSTFALGLTGGAQVDMRDTIAHVRYVDGPVDSTRVRARNTGIAEIALSSGLASNNSGDEDGGFAVNIPVSILSTNWVTWARVADATLTGSSGVTVSAFENAQVKNRQGAVTASGNLAGSVGVAVTNYNSDTLAEITDSTLDVGSVVATATTQSLLRSVAIRDGETEYGIDVITAILNALGETRAEIDNSDLTAGSVRLAALDGTRHDVFANGYAENAGAGASGGVGVDLYKRDTVARLSDGTVTTTGDIDLDARSEIKATNVILGHNGGASGLFEESESITGLANVAWTTDARDVLAEIDTVAVDAGGSVTVTASREDTFLAVEAGANRSAKGVGVGAGIFKFHGLTSARIVGDRALEVTGDVILTAENLTEVLQVGIGVTISGGFAAVGSYGYVDFGQRSDDLGQVDGDPRGTLLHDVVEDALNEGADFVEANTSLSLPDFDLTRESLIEARLDVDEARVGIGGNLELTAVDGREADVISGQVTAAVDISLANFILDMWTVERDPDTGKFTVAKRPDAPESEAGGSDDDEKEVDPGDDSEGADSFDQADSANADGQANEGGSGDSGGGEDNSPISFGLGVSWVRVGGAVDAIIDLENAGAFVVGEDTELTARSETKVMTASAGASVLGNAVGAGGAITRQAQLVRARVVGDGSLSTGGIGLTATSDNSMWAMAGVLSIGEDLGFGATLALNEMLARTQTHIGDSASVFTTAGDVRLAARDDTRVVSMGVAGVGSVNSTGISAANGLVFNRSAVDALIDGGAFITSAANVSAEAIRSQELAGLAYQIVIASGVGAGGALGLSVDKGFTTAKIEDATVVAEDDVIVRARNNTKVVSSGMGGGYGGSAGVTGSVSITIKNDTTSALISNALVQGGDVLVEALNGGRIDAIGGGDESFFGSFDQATLNVTIGNSAAVGVSVAVIDSASVVTAAITDDSIVTATNDAGEDGVDGTHRREENDLWLERETRSYHGVAVVADNSTEFNTLAMTGSGSAGVSVSAQIPVLFVEDSVVAQIAGGADVTSAADVDVFAANATKIKSISVTASFGTTAGIGAHNEFFRIEKNTAAGILQAEVDAARDVTVEAVKPESLSHFAVSGAVGIYAGVAGVNQVGITRSMTHAYVADSVLTSGRDTSIIATAPRQSRMTAGSGGGGFVGVGASIVILNAQDEVVAETTSGYASHGYADLTVGRDLLVHADAQTDPSEKVPFVNGQNGEGQYSVNQVVIGTGGGLVGIAGAGLYTTAKQKVTARIGDYTRIQGPDLNDVTVEAHQSYGQDVFVLTAAGGAISVGAAGVITSMRNAVLAEIGQGVNIAANGDVTVNAYGERDFTGAVVAGGGGAISAQGSGILLTYGKRVRLDDPDEETPDWQQQIDDADDNLQDDTFTNADDADPDDEIYGIAQGANPNGPQDGNDNLLAEMLGKVTSGRRSINLENSFNGTDEDTIETRIGANVTISALNVDLGSEEGGRLDILAGGASGGAISATHGVAIVRRGTNVVTNVGTNVAIDARSGNVTIGALANVDDGTPEAIAGSGGAIASSMGIVDMRVGRAVNVNIGNNVSLRANALTIEAEESSATEAKVSAGVGGAIGVGVAIAGARRESTVGVTLGLRGQAPTLSANDIVVEARRFGETDANVDLVTSGAIGVGGSSAVARDLSAVTVDLGNALFLGSDVTIRAINAGDVVASARGTVGGIGTTGLNNAVARRESTTTIIGTNISLDVGDITVLATDNVPGSDNAVVSAEARSTTIAGGSLNGSNTLARNDSAVTTNLRFSQFEVTGNAWLEARNEADLEYLSKGVTASLVGLGASLARGIDNSASILDVYFGSQATVGGTFTARSGGDGYLFGNAVAGKGGIVTVIASENHLTMDLTTELSLDGAGLTAASIDIASNRDVMFESNSDSIEVSLVGYGATRQINRVDSDSLLDIGIDLTGETIDIASTNDITKRAIDFNGVTGSFGGVNRTALVSRTEVESDAQINIGSGVTITQLSTTANPLNDTGYVNIAMRTNYDLTDRLTGDMGGAVPLPKLVSNVIVGAHDDDSVWSSGNIRMTGATIRANGDVNITARADAEMVSESYIRTYGLAGAGESEAHTILRHSSLIDLASGEIESRRGTISILAGADTSGVQEQYQHAETRVHNRTALPLNSDPDARAELRNQAFIDIGSGMSLVAAGDVNLETGDGITDPYAYGYAIDAYSEAAEAVGNFFGGLIGADEVSLARESGTFLSVAQTGVTVDGSVEAGAFAAKRINIDFAGAGAHPTVNDAGDLIITTEGDIAYELEFDRNIGQKILDFIEELEALRDEYDANSSVYDTLTTQIEALEARYDFLNSNGIGQLSTDFLYVTDESASGGNVNVTGDFFLGSGEITANGDALIEIVNNSSLSVEVSGLVIPFEDYGEVRYNGVSVDTIGDLVSLGANYDPTASGVGQVPAFDLTANNADATPPNIIISNTYTASNTGPTADVYVVGDVENRNGNVEIFTQDGSVYVFGGDINALSVTIDSGGDFFLAPSDPTTHITSDPTALYQDLFEAQEEWWGRVYDAMNDHPSWSQSFAIQNVILSGYAPPAEVLPVTTAPGSVTAVGNIFIYADVLNINGRIQSGVTDWDLTISSAIDTYLDGIGGNTIRPIYAPLRGTPVGSDEDQTNVDVIGGVGNNPPSTLGGEPYMTGNVSVNYNPMTDQLEIAPIRTRGGFIEISGKIISTGSGEIIAANGYGTLDIDSNSTRDLVFSHVDLGPDEGVEGVIRIIDKNKIVLNTITGGQPIYLTTEYRMSESGTNIEVDLSHGTDPVPSSVATYNPNEGLALYFTRAEDHQVVTVRTETQYESRTCFANINCQADESSSTTLVADGVPVFLDGKPDVGYIGYYYGNEDYSFLEDRDDIDSSSFSPSGTNPAWTETGWFAPIAPNTWRTRERDIVTVESTTWRRTFTHRLKADKPIDIDFIGNGYRGDATISSGGSVLFTENVRAPGAGTLTVEAAGDILTIGPETTMTARTAILTSGGDIGGSSSSGFRDRAYRINNPVEGREIYGRRTGADLQAGSTAYRNELLGAATSESAAQVALLNGSTVNLTVNAQGSIRLRNTSGSYFVNEVVSDYTDDIQIEAEGDIITSIFSDGLIDGGRVSLLSETGRIGGPESEPYGERTLTVNALDEIYVQAYGDIDLSTAGTFEVEEVASQIGNVSLTATGSIQDADIRETVDRRAEAALLAALWDELRLIDNDSLRTPTKAEIEDALADIVEDETQAYYDWWSWLVTYNDEGKAEVVRDYDPNIVLELTEQEKLIFRAKGTSEEEIAAIVQERTEAFHDAAAQYAGMGFDQEYRYAPTEAQRDAVTAELTQEKLDANPIIQREIANRTAEYEEWWSRLAEIDPDSGEIVGFTDYDEGFEAYTYDADRRAQMLANGLSVVEIDALEATQNAWFHDVADRYAGKEYDKDYAYAPDEEEIGALIKSAFFTTTELEAAFRRDLILPVLDTQLTIEAPNVIGRDVTLDAGLDVGKREDSIFIAAGETISKEDRLFLFSAARSDVEILADGVRIQRNEDFDIEASGDVTVRAGRHAYVGSEVDVALTAFEATQDARLRTSGAITATVGGTGLVGRSVAIEAAGGGIGSLATPLLYEQLSGGTLSARAAGEIHIFAGTSDISIEEIYSPERVYLEAKSGQIVDADPSSVIDILSRGVWLKSVGAMDLEVELTQPGAAIFAEAGGDLDLEVVGGDIALERVASTGGHLSFTNWNGGATVVHPSSASSAEGMTAFQGRDGITAWINGDITETSGLWTTFRTEGTVDLTSHGTAGDDTRALTIVADALALRVMPGAGELNATFNAFGDLTVNKLLAGTGDVTITATGHLINDLDAGSFNSFTMRTLGDAGTPSDIIFLRDFSTTAGQTFTAEAARNVNLGGDTLGFFGATTLTAGLRGAGSVAGATTGVIEGGTNAIDITAADNVRLFTVEHEGDLTIATTNGGVLLTDVEAAALSVTTGSTGDVVGQVTAREVDFNVGTIGYGGTGLSLNGDATALSLEVEGEAWIAPMGDIALNVVNMITGTGPVVINGQDADIRLSGASTVGGDLFIGGKFVAVDKTITGTADGASSAGQITIEAARDITFANGADIDAGQGYIDLEAGQTLRIAGLSSQQGGVNTIALTATTLTQGLGDISVINGQLVVNAGSVGTVTDPLRFNADRLSLDLGDGPAYLHALGPVEVQRWSGRAGHYDLYALGDVYFSGNVDVDRNAVVIATSVNGNITADVREPVSLSGHVFLTAFNGTVQGQDDTTPFALKVTDALAEVNVAALDEIDISASGDLTMGYAVSQQGPVTLRVDGALDLALAGSPDGLDLDYASLTRTPQHGSDQALDTTPASAAPVQNEDDYPIFNVFGPDGDGGETGGGETGGGETGGGETGGGETGGGETGGGETGGGETGGGETGGGETGGGETGGGETGGGETGGGETGGGETGGGETGGGETGGGETGGGETGGGETGGGETGGGETGGGDTGGGDTGSNTGTNTGGPTTGGGQPNSGGSTGKDGDPGTDPSNRLLADPRILIKPQRNPLPGSFTFGSDRGEEEDDEEEEEENAEGEGEDEDENAA